MKSKCKNCRYRQDLEKDNVKKQFACTKQQGKIVQKNDICEEYQREYPGWKETDGYLVKRSFGSDGEIVMHVRYSVDDKSYICREYLRYKKHKATKIGGIPIGYKSIPAVVPGELNTRHTILYDPTNPKKSHIFGNDGVIW